MCSVFYSTVVQKEGQRKLEETVGQERERRDKRKGG